jgi:hypothetical protein
MAPPKSSEIRFRVDPGDVPPEKAARRLHLTLARFNELLPRLRQRGFPGPDPDTGMFDLEEIDRWRKKRHEPDEPALTNRGGTEQPPPENVLGMGDRFVAALKERRAKGRKRTRT